jgi:GNAT superfamily N-acetyltransferase
VSWQCERVEVWQVDPDDEDSLVAWHAVLQAVERHDWPDRTGFSLRDVRAFAAHRGGERRFVQLAAREPGGPLVGVGVMELPLRDNLHSAEVTVGVHPEHRRKGAGSAIVARMAERAAADGRRALNSIVDEPVAQVETHPAAPFARRVGFVATMPGNSRYLAVPLDAGRRDELWREVGAARDAADYRTFTFTTPWPAEFVEDHCELARRMSTDEPAGDSERDEEVWDADRIHEGDALLAARGVWKLAAVAQHAGSGRLVAFSELLLSPDAPTESWQMATLVHPDHRGHRLGLAVKLANVDALATAAPSVRRIVTGNAQENAPMIAVNDMMGFEIAGAGWFWQKQVR